MRPSCSRVRYGNCDFRKELLTPIVDAVCGVKTNSQGIRTYH